MAHRSRSHFAIAFVVALITLVTALPTSAYFGTLSLAAGQLETTAPPVSLDKSPGRQQDVPISPCIYWIVTQNQNLSWHYSYSIHLYWTDVSNCIIEASATFTAEDLLNQEGSFSQFLVGMHSHLNPGNPQMPRNLYGIKFDDFTGSTATIEFDSWRSPVWGDFYAKGGKIDGQDELLWNAGFAEIDPAAPAADGSISNHILVPDTTVSGNPSAPEPGSLASLALLATAGLRYIRRRR